MRNLAALLAVTTLGLGGAAEAHKLACKATVNGEHSYRITHYPVRLVYRYSVRNALWDRSSTAQSIWDTFGYTSYFQPMTPFTLYPSAWVSNSYERDYKDRYECMDDAKKHGWGDMVRGELRVTWDSGYADCDTTVECGEERCSYGNYQDCDFDEPSYPYEE